MFRRTHRRWSSFFLAFTIPILILVQQPYSRGSEAKLTAEQIVALSTKPAVVRIENACAAAFEYKHTKDGKEAGRIVEYGESGEAMKELGKIVEGL